MGLTESCSPDWIFFPRNSIVSSLRDRGFPRPSDPFRYNRERGREGERRGREEKEEVLEGVARRCVSHSSAVGQVLGGVADVSSRVGEEESLQVVLKGVSDQHPPLQESRHRLLALL